jgi:hypothetical protein
MSDGREERAEQEARREWEKTHRSADPDAQSNHGREYERIYEQDGAGERNAS